MRVLTVLTLIFAAGCAKKRDPAPTEMEDLTGYLFANWEDEEALPEGIDNLAAWLADNIDSEQAEDGWLLTPLTADLVADVDRPDRDLGDLLGAAVAAPSPFPLLDHAGHIVLDDQMFSNPKTYEHYHRKVTGDERAFLDGDGLVRTTNDIATSSLGVTIPYELLKDYRWVHSDDSEAILARSWIEDEACNDGGGNCLVQSFSIDLFLKHRTGETWRMTATWSELTMSVPIGENLLIATLAVGMNNVFRYTDEFLAEQDARR
ncbi:MAG: hypothetical protein R2707_21305 [Acidimicrobiales bacterium]